MPCLEHLSSQLTRKQESHNHHLPTLYSLFTVAKPNSVKLYSLNLRDNVFIGLANTMKYGGEVLYNFVFTE